MDFAWVVDALRRGLRVTRKAWAGDPPMYLYMVTEKKPDGKHIIKMNTGTGQVFEWTPTAEQILIVDDWEEYVDPKEGIRLCSVTGETIKVTHEELPVWPEVNADGYARMCKGSDVIIHDGVYRPPKKEPAKTAEDQSDYAKEVRKIVDGLPEDYYKVQLIDALVDALADKISQRVAQFLQAAKDPDPNRKPEA